jgi:hypothetical protein
MSRLERVVRRAKYAAVGGAVGGALGGLVSPRAASTGAGMGALVGATVAEKQEAVDGLLGRMREMRAGW